ncbi:MAG: glycerol-3-phosphate 1-O-acyltransferase PlsY [Rhizobiaceae bacterium]
MTLGSLVALVFGYLLGSIPFGLVLTRAAGLGDVRAIGSGNIGATNVLRTGNKKLAAATLACDMLKGTVAVLAAGAFGPAYAAIAGFGAFIGHLFPVWLRFKGGKGVATFLGVVLGLLWPAALLFAVVWIALAATLRYSSLAGLSASAAVVLYAFFTDAQNLPALFFIMAAIVFIKHHANIRRLIAGTEPRIGAKG